MKIKTVSAITLALLLIGVLTLLRFSLGDVPTLDTPIFELLNKQSMQVEGGVDMMFTLKNTGSPASTGTVWIPWEKVAYDTPIDGSPPRGTIIEVALGLDVNGDGDESDVFNIHYVNDTQVEVEGEIAEAMRIPEQTFGFTGGRLEVQEKVSFTLGSKSHALYIVRNTYASFALDTFFHSHPSPNIELIISQIGTSINSASTAEITSLKLNGGLVPYEFNWKLHEYNSGTGEWSADNAYVYPLDFINSNAVFTVELSISGEPGSYRLYAILNWAPDTDHRYRYVIDEIYQMPFYITRTWYVDDDGPADFHIIQEAINAANPGDTIFIRNGTYHEHVIVNKKVNLIGENRNKTIVDGSGTGTSITVTADHVLITNLTIQNGYNVPHINYGLYIYNSKDVMISGNILLNNDISVFLYHSDNCIVGNNIISDSYRGVDVTHGNNNRIENNVIEKHEEGGVVIGSYAEHNIVLKNEILKNLFGILLGWSNNNSITGNNVTLNDEAGIRLDSSNNTVIAENKVTSNTRDGIVLYGSFNNRILKNYLIQNGWNGIALWYSNSNQMYHNNFIDNNKQVHIEYGPASNVWDNGYPSGGNYWSDFTGADVRSGPYQNITGSDLIVDIPKVLDANNRDHYPLVKPYVPLPCDLNEDRKVDIDDIVEAALAFGSYPDHLRWKNQADINQDNKIDIDDIILIAMNFGKT